MAVKVLRLASWALVGLVSALPIALSGTAWAQTGITPQSIAWQQVPDLLVGQFAAVTATASSGLPVAIAAEGPCVVRPVVGSPVVVATAGGECTLVATQAGNDDYAPAPTVQQQFTFVRAESDISLVIPGPDVLVAGQELRVFVSVSGEAGDDPDPRGAVVVRVRDAGGVVVTEREALLDLAGHALVTVPGEVTSEWAAGASSVEAAYGGDGGFLPTISGALPLAVTKAGCPMGADCATPDRLNGAGGIEMHVITPYTPIAGGQSQVRLTGFPRNGIVVDFTILDTRRPDDPVHASASSTDGEVRLDFSTGRAGTYGDMTVNASYRFYYDDLVYRDTLVQNYHVYAGRARLMLVAPDTNGGERWETVDRDLTDFGMKTAKARVWVEWDGSDAEPTFSGVDGSGRTWCPQMHVGDRRQQHRQPIDFYTWDSCRLTLRLQDTPEFLAPAPVTTTIIAQCPGRSRQEGWHRCDIGGEPIDSVEPTAKPKGPDVGSTLVLDSKPSSSPADATLVQARQGDAIHIRVPWPRVGDSLTIAEWRGNRWTTLGTAEVGADGLASLPTVRFATAGIHRLKIIDLDTGYVNVDVIPT